MGSDAEDIGLTIHPHPTLSETVGFAAEMAEGTITDLLPPRKRRVAGAELAASRARIRATTVAARCRCAAG